MALQSSGQISLNDMHVEAGGTTGTSASINDTDIRGLISATSGSEMQFSDWYGASSAPTLVGSGSRSEDDLSFFGSSATINITGAGVQTGDFVVIALTSDNTINQYNLWNGMSGLKRVDGTDATVTPSSNATAASPGWEAVSGVWQSGDSNPWISPITYVGRPIALCFAVFRNVTGRQQHEWSTNAASGSPNPPSVSAVAGNTSIIICTGHLDDRNLTMTAPTGYTMAVAVGADDKNKASSAIAYKITTDNGAQDPGAFGTGGALDAWAGTTVRA